MKKGLFIAVCILFVTSLVAAADFNPTLMKITAPNQIQYNFDGSELSIPVTVSGVAAGAHFFVYTKDKASSIGPIQNGYLGWHFVNKLDTCIYISPFQQLDIGTHTIKWNGKNNDGGIVPAGEYTYYVWGYDNKNPKNVVTMGISFTPWMTLPTVVTHNTDGSPKTRPVIYVGGTQKLAIGSDPLDATLIETTAYTGGRGDLALDNQDHNYFFVSSPKSDPYMGRVAKYKWVPNGESVLQTNWGDQGFAEFPIDAVGDYHGEQLVDVENNILVGSYDQSNEQTGNYLTYIAMDDGTVEKQVDLSDRWFSTDDLKAGGQGQGGPGQLFERNGYVLMSTFCACYREMIRPLAEDEADFVAWGNGNGDIVGDHNFETDSPRPWVCFDFMPAPYSYITDADRNLFSTFGAYDLGAVSFGLIGPDGTGIDYYAFAGETAGWKCGTTYIDYDSAYDGILTENISTTGTVDILWSGGIWFAGQDSFKGIISSKPVAVDESAPSAFTVAQNSPNPFNPTTTISFKIPESATVSIDVFNVAGQKIDTIANGFMASGNHSVTWDASGFSAGVYFYTVKAGDFARTMKMTLLK